MANELTDEQVQARRTRVAASNRVFGRVLSVVGFLLASVTLGLLIGGATVMSSLDRALGAGATRSELEPIAGAAATAMTAAPGVILLFAMCALIPGEQMRRGWIAPSPVPQTGILPSASMVSQFRVLGFGWHLLWSGVGLAVSAVLLGLPVAGWFTGGWPSTLRSSYDFTGFWIIYGSLAFAITVASLVSLAKKAWYAAAVRRGTATAAGGPGRAFWRWVDYRWRFDLWLGGIGGLLLALSLTFLSGAVGPGAAADQAAAVLGSCALLAGVGLALVIVAVVAAAQFWRAGESLGSGESFA